MVRAFQRFDVDGDASVTLDEYTKPLSKIVERRDRNGDGAISRSKTAGMASTTANIIAVMVMMTARKTTVMRQQI